MVQKRRLQEAGIVFLFLTALLLFVGNRDTRPGMSAGETMAMPAVHESELYAGLAARLSDELLKQAGSEEPQDIEDINTAPEEEVYSFLQGPKSWEEGRPWSGEWAGNYTKGRYFGSFGCGFCCLANIYSTLTDKVCSPWDMYEYAGQVSGYVVTKKSAALGWGDMKVILQKTGFECTLNQKSGSYTYFQQQIAQAKSAVVLVSSDNDDTYWKETSGHYVNIWLYNEETDKVFVTDPGDPDRNRSWIPLRYVYDALKTVSQYQYLLVLDYNDENNQWQHNGIDEIWNMP